METKKKTVYVCSECGSADITIKMFVNPNNTTVQTEYLIDCGDDECWCDNCEEYCGIDEVEVIDEVN